MDTSDLIVVGVDGSQAGDRALLWAATEANRTNSTIQAITVWTWDGVEGAMLAATSPIGQREHAERISLHAVEAVKAANGTSTPIASKVVEGRPVPVLVEASRTARLHALGSHGSGWLHRVTLGTTSAGCVQSAACPVVVLPASRHTTVASNRDPVPVP